MPQWMYKKEYLKSVVWLAGGIFAILVAFIPAQTNADHLQPPTEAKCKTEFGLPAHTFVCTGEKISNAVLISRDGIPGGCLEACREESGGIALRYDKGTVLSKSRDWYCYGATKEIKCIVPNSATLSGDTVSSLSVATGQTWQQTQDEFAKEANNCGVNVFCILKKIFFVAANFGLIFFIGGPVLIFTMFMLVVAGASGLLATVLNNILFRGVVQATLNIPVIPGKGVSVIDIGWEFSRDFANLFFLIILVFIGLATILRLPSYQMKKTLPLLLIMAVLVNFSGLLVGFVVDMSNIVTNFFFARMGTWEDLSILLELLKTMFVHIANLFRFDNDPRGYFLTLLTPATTAAVVAAFFVMLMVVFFYATLLFIIRVAALWTLSILSPFAFLSYVLPQTRSIWNRWLKELIAWSFMGVPLGFFLYLSTFILRHSWDIAQVYSPGRDFKSLLTVGALKMTPDQLLELSIQAVIAPTIAIIFLFIGIRISRQMAPSGAQAAINYTKKAAMGAMAFAGTQTFGRLMQGKGGALVQKIAKSDFGTAKFFNKLKEDNATDSNPLRRTARSAVMGFGGGAMWAVRKGASLALQYKSTQAKGLDSSMGELEKQYGKDPDSIAASYASAGNLDYQRKMAIILQLAKIKGGKGISKLSTDQQREAIRLIAAYQGGKMADVIKHNPALIEDEQVGTLIQKTLVSDGAEKDDSGKYKDKDMQALAESARRRGLPIDGQALITEAAYKKAVDEMGAADLDNADKALMENEKFKEMVARWKPWNFIRKIGQEWGGDMLDKLQEQAEKMTTEKDSKWTALHEVAKTNPSFFKAIDTPEGRMFMRAWEGRGEKPIEEKQDIKTFMQKVKTTPLPSKPEVPKDTELEKALKEPKGLPDIQALKMSGTLKDRIRQGNTELQAIKANIQLLKQMIQNQKEHQMRIEEFEKLLSSPEASPEDKDSLRPERENLTNALETLRKEIDEKKRAINQQKSDFEKDFRVKISEDLQIQAEAKKAKKK